VSLRIDSPPEISQELCRPDLLFVYPFVRRSATPLSSSLIATEDDASSAVQAAIVNVAGLISSSAGGALIQTIYG